MEKLRNLSNVEPAMTNVATYVDHLQTPLGVMEVVANQTGVVSIHFVDNPKPVNANSLTQLALQQLGDYYSGSRETFELPLEPDGTDFQKRVWHFLRQIEFGKTLSYKEIAQQIGNPKGVRAVGLANGKNPLTIVIPCHRVIGANGSLTGYASGLKRKAWLLHHEGLSLF